ncbi:MAG: NAD(P)-dependent alcohol dehydrogenase [Gemmatimonadales bacterium]
MIRTAAYAGFSAKAPLGPHTIDRREPGPTDIRIEILFCGVCHSDLHTVRDEWDTPTYPCVPGHEIVGRVAAVGSTVTRFKPGDLAAVGCMVDSCGNCRSCNSGLEQYCDNRKVTWTYDSPDPHTGGVTYGGYSTTIVVDEHFVLSLPASLELSAAAPLLCAGITTYSPLRHWGAGPGRQVGIVGLGGLGHMGVKLAHALGAHVTLFTTSAGKVDDARRMGADEIIVTKGAPRDWPRPAAPLNLIIDTVAASHDLNPYLRSLDRDGALVLVGLPENHHPPIDENLLTSRRRSLAGSGIGGIAETQEMLNFCAAHGIACDVEVIAIQQINEAYERMLRSDVKYRFVIDMASLRE